MVMICWGDWQLLIGLIQPLGPFSSLAALDTAVLLSNGRHRDPWESAGGVVRWERYAYIKVTRSVINVDNLNQSNENKASCWKLCRFHADLALKALERVVVSPLFIYYS